MGRFKKLLSFALAVLLLSALPLSSALAEGGAISLSEAESFRGEEVLLTVSMDANPGLMYLSLRPVYDGELLELLGIEAANDDWYVGTSSAIWDAGEDSAFTGAMLTLRFRVKEEAPLGRTPVSVETEAYNYAEEEVPFTVSAGGVTVALPENAGIITVSDGRAAPGETLDLSVSVETNPGLMYLSLSPVYDEELLELLSMEATAEEGWYIGAKAAVWDQTEDSDFTGQVLTLHFRVKEDAPQAQTVVRLQVEAANYNEEEIPFDVRGGQVRIGDAVETVTVTFDAAGGSVSPESVEVSSGEAIGTLPTPEREGWVFLGWFTAPMESYVLAGQGTPVTAESVFEEDGTAYAHWRLPGDINGDGKLNNKDVTRLQKHLKGDEVEINVAALDVNGDGKVNNKDLTRLQKYLKGDEVEIH